MNRLRFAVALSLASGFAGAAAAANLVTNGNFARDISGWSGPAAGAAWQPFDSLDRLSSGSISMTINREPGHGTSMVQCIAVTPDAAYDAGARLMLPGGQPKAQTGLAVNFYASNDCTGDSATGKFSGWITTQSNGAFLPVALRNFAADHTAHSAMIQLILLNSDPGTVTAYFDDVIFAPSGGCVPDDKTLCLEGGRFEVNSTYAAAGAEDSDAQVVQLTSDSGYMWFFGPDNVEITLKVLDGCGVNQNHWVFAAGMTNVRVDLTVRDTTTGTIRNYANPPGTPFEAILDTSAFRCP